MKIAFLGTTSMVPTAERNHTGILVSHESENILVDCGEGTQRQLRIKGFPIPRLTRVLLTHWHGDHYFGLPGLIENLGKNKFQNVLEIYGPVGSRKIFNSLSKALRFQTKIKVHINEIKKDCQFLKNDFVEIYAYNLEHSAPCLGYVIKEADKIKINLDYIKRMNIPEGPILSELQKGKDINFMGKKIKARDATYIKPGKKVGIIMDTKLCRNCYKIGKDADLLICDSTYHSSLKEKARKYLHMTSLEAALVARKSKAKKLVLTHFSQRYKDVSELESEAGSVFQNSMAAKDFLELGV